MADLQEGGSGEHIWTRRNILGLAGWASILGALSAGGFRSRDCLICAIERDDLMAASSEARHHVQTHSAQANESDLHECSGSG